MLRNTSENFPRDASASAAVPRRRRRRTPVRRGATAVLAMLYLVLFSTMAVGFYAATTTAVQVSHNDEKIARAFAASESGLEFARYHLARVTIPSWVAPDDVAAHVASDLQAALENTGNFPGAPVALSGRVINIPADPNGFVKLDSAGFSGFRATVVDQAEQGKVVVKVQGRYGTTQVGRAIQMEFTRVPRLSSIFDYAVASRGQIVMAKGAVTSLDPNNAHQATLMSAMTTSPAIHVSGGAIGGELTIMDDPATAILVTGGSVAGESNPVVIETDHLSKVDEPPVFPDWDTEVYRAYATATTTGAAGNTVLKNTRIPAGTNPTFNGNATVQGIMYIESPNTVTINGSLNLNGFIVFEGEGTADVNSLVISGNITTGPLPSAPEFDPVRTASGVAILAPTTSVLMTGSARGTLKGNVVTGKFATDGNPSEIIIDHGTLVTMNEEPNSAHFNGKTIKFNGTGANNLPTVGMTFAGAYDPEPETYEELRR